MYYIKKIGLFRTNYLRVSYHVFFAPDFCRLLSVDRKSLYIYIDFIIFPAKDVSDTAFLRCYVFLMVLCFFFAKHTSQSNMLSSLYRKYKKFPAFRDKEMEEKDMELSHTKKKVLLEIIQRDMDVDIKGDVSDATVTFKGKLNIQFQEDCILLKEDGNGFNGKSMYIKYQDLFGSELVME